MEFFILFINYIPSSFQNLSKALTDVFDKIISVIEYLYPDFGVWSIMSEELAKDYAAYFNLDLTCNLQTVQDVIDNMITRLEELTSVLHMIKTKNNDCCSTVTSDISTYRNEITILTKKIITLSDVILKLQSNIEILEQKVEKAETDFDMKYENKFKSLFRPFLKRNKDIVLSESSISSENLTISSINEYFENR